MGYVITGIVGFLVGSVMTLICFSLCIMAGKIDHEQEKHNMMKGNKNE